MHPTGGYCSIDVDPGCVGGLPLPHLPPLTASSSPPPSACRSIYNLGPDAEVSLSFGCKVPGEGGEVVLEGASSFDAAVHLASISAGERLQRAQQAGKAHDSGAAAAAAAAAVTPAPSSGRRWHLFH